VITALAVHLRDARHRRVVVGLLAPGGLVRPETWLLSLAYAAGHWRPWTSRERVTAAALALAGPML
jgi:hypothetical protein